MLLCSLAADELEMLLSDSCSGVLARNSSGGGVASDELMGTVDWLLLFPVIFVLKFEFHFVSSDNLTGC